MTKSEEILALLEDHMLPEIEDYIDEMFALIASKKASEDDKIAVTEAQEVRADFKEIAEDVRGGQLDEVEIEVVLKELTAMHNGEELDNDEDDEDEEEE